MFNSIFIIKHLILSIMMYYVILLWIESTHWNNSLRIYTNIWIIIVFSITVLKLLKMAKGIRALLDTVMQALPQVGNLGLLFFLLFFIFAALGVELFGRLGKFIYINILYYIVPYTLKKTRIPLYHVWV